MKIEYSTSSILDTAIGKFQEYMPAVSLQKLKILEHLLLFPQQALQSLVSGLVCMPQK